MTGASGIAAAAAHRFAAEGAAVHVASLDAGQCASLAARIRKAGGTCTWTAGDLREEPVVTRAVEECRAAEPPLLEVAPGRAAAFIRVGA